MTKDRIARLINLAVQRADEDGLCNTEDAVAYNDLLMEFQSWDPEAVPDESAELKLAYDTLFAESDHYRESLAFASKSWSDLCCYWHERANALEVELQAFKEKA